MKWIKLGKIFDPTEFKLANNCVQFAKSPQALVFDNYVRIYFSTIETDVTGKYISHIAYVYFEKNFKKIIRISDKTVVPIGKLGCFDEHGIFPINPLKYKDQIWGYTSGWSRRVSVSVDTSIGLAISNDGGDTFQKIGDGPILTSSLQEPCLIVDAFVKVYDNMFHMWYVFGKSWKRFIPSIPPDRTYKIGHAVSKDGVNWEKEEAKQIITDKLNVYESQALPTVVKFANRYHMFFCYRQSSDFRTNKNRAYRMGYAFSDDLNNWTRDDEQVGIDVSKSGWDSEMMCYPHVFKCDGKVYMLYNGNEFGRYGFGLAVLEQ